MENYSSSASTTFRPRKSIFKKPNPDETPRLALNGQILDVNHKNFDSFEIESRLRHPNHQQRKNQTCPSFYISHTPQNIQRTMESRTHLYQSTIRPQSVGGKSITFNKNPVNLFHSMCPTPNISRINTQSPIKPQQRTIYKQSVKPYQRVICMQPKTASIYIGPQTQVIPVQHVHQIQPVQHIHQIQPVQQIRVIETVQDQTIINQVNKLNSINQMLVSKYSQVSEQLTSIKQHTQQKSFVEDQIFLQKSVNKIDQIFLKETNMALTKMCDLYLLKKSGIKRVFKKIDMNSRYKQNQMNSRYRQNQMNSTYKQNQINSRVKVVQNNSYVSAISYHSKDNSPSKLSLFQKLKF